MIAPRSSGADEISRVARRGAKDRAALSLSSESVAAAALLEYLPFRYDDLRFPTPARRLGETGGEENAVGRVAAVKERRVRGLEIVEARLTDDFGDSFVAKWIGRNRYVYGRFHDGMRLFVRGRVERTLSGPIISVSHYAQLGEADSYRGELVPIYRASKELASRKIAMVMKKNLARLIESAPPDPLPASLADARGYGGLAEAYRAVHSPRHSRRGRTRPGALCLRRVSRARGFGAVTPHRARAPT